MGAFRSGLLARALFSAAVLASQGASPASAQDEAAGPGNATVGELVVTGSRIRRPNLDQPTPVSTIGRQSIQGAGTSNLGDVIAQLPAMNASGTARGNANSFGNLGGLNFSNLRGLGTSRTLTLVDGRRHVAGDAGDSAVDLNAVPPALVDRVEVITGGASAIYGSDAVSGVINIITKKAFEGVEAQAETGRPTRGSYGADTSASITAGGGFDHGRAHAAASLVWDQTKGVRAKDIRSLNNYGAIVLSDPFDGAPDRRLAPNVVSEFIDENGVLLGLDLNTGNLAPIAGFSRAGVPVTQPARVATSSLAFGQFAAPCDTCFALEDWVLLVSPTRRRGVSTTFRYALTPQVEVFAEGKFIESRVHDYVQPSFSFGDFALAPDNAFITPAIQARLDAAGPDVAPLIARFNGDVGPRINNIKRETWRIVTGFEGKVDAGFAELSWELAYNRGQTRNLFRGQNYGIPGNFAAALDAVRDPATGQIRCRVDVPALQAADYAAPEGLTAEACVPFNPFGQQNGPAALDYVRHDQFRRHRIDQEVVTGTFTFDTGRFFSLPGGAAGFAGGFERRKETSENINDLFVKQGLSEIPAQPDASGGFDVKEVFAEGRLPIFAGAPFARELTLDAAVRYADYSTVGSATAWKAGFVYAPVRDLKFRGTYSKAVRAPNITEAFLPASGGFELVTDPCDAADIGRDPDRAANCRALGVPTGFVANDNQSVGTLSSGNSHLKAEKADSWTLGLVVQPRWTAGLTLTADYYDIRIRDAITLVEVQDIVDNCVDATGGPDRSFCGLFTRDATGNIDFVQSTFLNASKLETAGWDLAVDYAREIGDLTGGLGPLGALDGRFSASLTASHLDKLRLFAFQDRPDEQEIREATIGNPEWKLLANLSYSQGPVEVSWKSRFISRSVRYSRDPQRDGAEALSPSQIEPSWRHDVTARFRMPDVLKGAEVYAGVNNIFDEEIPLGIVQGDGADAAYDLLGRYVFAGVRARF